MNDQTKQWLQVTAIAVPLVIFLFGAIMAYGMLRQEVTDVHAKIDRLEERFLEELKDDLKRDAPDISGAHR